MDTKSGAQEQTLDLSPDTHRTYLLTWDPSRYPWSNVRDTAEQVAQTGSARRSWSVGNRKDVSIGDRVFLMRQGRDDPGLVGSGTIEGQVTESDHWDPKEAAAGRTYRWVQVKWDTLRETPLLSRPVLEDRLGEKKLWTSRSGGVLVAAPVSRLLESLWRAVAGAPAPDNDLEKESLATRASDGVTPSSEDVRGLDAESKAISNEEERKVGKRLDHPPTTATEFLTQLDESGRNVLASAWGLAQGMGDTKIHMDHLIGGLLKAGRNELHPILEQVGTDFEAVLARARRPGDEPLPATWTDVTLHADPPFSRHVTMALGNAVRWSRIKDRPISDVQAIAEGALWVTQCSVISRIRRLGLRADTLPWAQPSPIRPAGFSPDQATGDDLLGFEHEARTMAALVTAQGVAPPLSIGLFGPWGSGKSFFMGLLQKEVRRLEDLNSPDYCKHVVQIRFNAWHYIDSNLWASLANEVFEQLGKEIEAGGARLAVPTDQLDERVRTDQERRRRARTRLLMAARKSRSELELAERRTQGIAEELARVEGDVRALEDEKWMLSADIPNRAIASAALSRFQLLDEERTRLAAALEVSGLDAEGADPVAVMDGLSHWRGKWAYGVAWWHAARSASKRQWLTLALLVTAAALLIFVAPLLGELVSAWVVRTTGLVVAAASLFVPHWKTVKNAVRQVRPVAERFARFAEAVREQELAKVQPRLETVTRRLDRAQARESATRQQLQTAETDLKELFSDTEMRQLVQGRLKDREYRKELGVIAQARQDFEQLSWLLEGARTVTEAVTKADAAEEQELAKYRSQLPGVDRIVLYIDDLDRCPEDKVVDILQAVHLLLAFRLFVVVVGVDPDWLLHSLSKRSDVFRKPSPDGGNKERARRWRSTPMDYLEKIFQIPFHLRGMGESGFGDMIDSLTSELPQLTEDSQDLPVSLVSDSVDSGAAAASERSTTDASREESSGQAEQPEASPPAVHLPPQKAGTKSAQRPTPVPTVDGDGGEALPDPDEGTLDGTAEEVQKNRHPEPRLAIAHWEREFMRALHPFVRSPRSTTRFVNLYRLIRATFVETTTETAPEDPNRFVVLEDDAHRNVLFLLAMQMGHPAEATHMFEHLAALPTASMAWRGHVEELLDDPTSRNSDHDHLIQDEWVRFLGKIRQAHKELDDRQIEFKPLVEDLLEWTPKVRRFSFHSGQALRGGTNQRVTRVDEP